MTHAIDKDGGKVRNARAHHKEPAFAVYVINLPDATMRRLRMEEHLEALCVAGVNFVSGVNGAALDSRELADLYDDKSARATLGRSMSRGEIGCALSHCKAYNLLLESEKQYALILEDDALLSDAALRLVVSDRIREFVTEDGARIVLMSRVSQFLQRNAIPLGGGYRIVKVRNAWFTHGYLINRAAAKELVVHNCPVRFVADHWIEHEASSGIDVRAVDPCCIGLHELANQSQIEDVRYASIPGFPGLHFAKHLARRITRRVANVVFYGPIFGFRESR
ncbi:MAG: glycosyltransferase family 25 protein [Betaproteobacteria bacterium]|nr:glycosyltransferase family 25 protein [Betaproteobacteria bacterium]